MSVSLKQRDLRAFFDFVTAPDRTAQSLARAYVGFHGDINWGQQELFATTLREALGLPAEALPRSAVLGPRGELSAELAAGIAPELAQAYFAPDASPDLDSVTILPESRNEWQDHSLPAPINMRIGLPIRPAFAIFRARIPTLFATPYGYQAFDGHRGVFWPELSSRAFGRGVADYPRERLDAPVVVAMDQFDGANFCHFLCDTVSRVLHFCERFRAEAGACVFLLGGEPGPLQRLVVRLICDRTRLDERQFRFLDGRVVFETQREVFFFSDQGARNVHPMQMCHPASLRLVRDLFARLVPGEPLAERVFISRADADLRRIVNEDGLSQTLAGRGFRGVRLAEHDILRQWSIIAGARTIVAPHGMGLTWLLFHRGMANVLELFHPTIGSDAYAFMCRALGMGHDALIGEDAGDARAGYTIDVERVMSHRWVS